MMGLKKEAPPGLSTLRRHDRRVAPTDCETLTATVEAMLMDATPSREIADFIFDNLERGVELASDSLPRRRATGCVELCNKRKDTSAQ